MSRVQQIQKTSESKSDEMGGEIVLKSTCAEKQNQLAAYQVRYELDRESLSRVQWSDKTTIYH